MASSKLSFCKLAKITTWMRVKGWSALTSWCMLTERLEMKQLKEQGCEADSMISKTIEFGEAVVNKIMLVEFKQSTFRVIIERRRKMQFNA